MSEDDRDESVCLITAKKKKKKKAKYHQIEMAQQRRNKGEAKAENREKEIDIFSRALFCSVCEYYSVSYCNFIFCQ